MSALLRRVLLPFAAVAALTVVATASAGESSPASGTIGFGPLPGRTEVQKGSKIVVEGVRQAGIDGTISRSPIIGRERRVRHASGRLKWTVEFADVPFDINAPGCPAFATLTVRLVGHVKAGESVLHGRFRARSETGDVRLKGDWTVTEVISGVGGQPLFGPTSESRYSGRITCKTVGPGGGDDEEDDEGDD